MTDIRWHFFSFGATAPLVGLGLFLIHEDFFLWFLDHTLRHTTVGRTPLDEWSHRRRDLYLTTHNTHYRQTSMPPGGIRTHDLSRRLAVDLGLRPRDHWEGHLKIQVTYSFQSQVFFICVLCTVQKFLRTLKKKHVLGLSIKFANSSPFIMFIMNLYQLDKQSTKFTIWKYWKGCVKKLDGNDPKLLPTTHRSWITTMHLLTRHCLWGSF